MFQRVCFCAQTTLVALVGAWLIPAAVIILHASVLHTHAYYSVLYSTVMHFIFFQAS